MRTGTCVRCGDPFEDRSPAQGRRFCSDNCRKRHQDNTTGRAPCPKCGGPMGAGSKTRASTRSLTQCGSCVDTATERMWDAILDGYRRGLTAYEISTATGIPRSTITTVAYKMRQNGVDIPKAPRGVPSHRSRREAA